jgi:hypothetical protein
MRPGKSGALAAAREAALARDPRDQLLLGPDELVRSYAGQRRRQGWGGNGVLTHATGSREHARPESALARVAAVTACCHVGVSGLGGLLSTAFCFLFGSCAQGAVLLDDSPDSTIRLEEALAAQERWRVLEAELRRCLDR